MKISDSVDEFFREHPDDGARVTLTHAQWNELHAQLAPDNNARRERLATQLMGAMLSSDYSHTRYYDFAAVADDAADAADALISRLDLKEKQT